MIDVVCWYIVAAVLIFATVAVAVILVIAYDFWKESDLKKDLDERRRNRRMNDE